MEITVQERFNYLPQNKMNMVIDIIKYISVHPDWRESFLKDIYGEEKEIKVLDDFDKAFDMIEDIPQLSKEEADYTYLHYIYRCTIKKIAEIYEKSCQDILTGLERVKIYLNKETNAKMFLNGVDSASSHIIKSYNNRIKDLKVLKSKNKKPRYSNLKPEKRLYKVSEKNSSIEKALIILNSSVEAIGMNLDKCDNYVTNLLKRNNINYIYDLIGKSIEDIRNICDWNNYFEALLDQLFNLGFIINTKGIINLSEEVKDDLIMLVNYLNSNKERKEIILWKIGGMTL